MRDLKRKKKVSPKLVLRQPKNILVLIQELCICTRLQNISFYLLFYYEVCSILTLHLKNIFPKLSLFPKVFVKMKHTNTQ